MTDSFLTQGTSAIIKGTPRRIAINDRAATRAAIFRRITAAGFPAIERSDWAARDMNAEFKDDWDYSMIAIHHAGRSYSCGPGSLQMQQIQREHKIDHSDDVGYHYGIDCSGFIFEGRDIRYKGRHVKELNTGIVGIVLLANLTTVEEGGDAYAKIRTGVKEKTGYEDVQIIPSRQIDALIALVGVLKSAFDIFVLGGHIEFPKQVGKICPGNVGMELVRVLRSQYGLLPPPKPRS